MRTQDQTREKIGHNVTGIEASVYEDDMLDAHERVPRPSGDPHGIAQVRIRYAEVARPVGTVPPPRHVRGLARSVVEMLKGNDASVLLDKLGERLAFERAGTRLYDGLLAKLDAYGSWNGGPTRAQLEEHRIDELEHLALCTDLLEQMGADPTALTPSADLQLVATKGMIDVIVDPRTTLLQSCEAALGAEMLDNACWDTLLELLLRADQQEMAARCREALRTEGKHVERMRRWVERGLIEKAQMGLSDVVTGARQTADEMLHRH